MHALMEDEPEKYQSHFSVYLKSGLEPDSIEEMYKKVHVAIRAYPSPKKSGKQPPKQHKRCLIVNAQEIDHNMKNASAIVEFINSICTYI
ncbi:60S ribosomal protein L5-like, partial [Capsicum annuum]|uniref:60S ribosomal protein L5-like n=1 Tax=Capsicum annuum TaxID=4072 RepID=UPI001FB0B4D6